MPSFGPMEAWETSRYCAASTTDSIALPWKQSPNGDFSPLERMACLSMSRQLFRFRSGPEGEHSFSSQNLPRNSRLHVAGVGIKSGRCLGRHRSQRLPASVLRGSAFFSFERVVNRTIGADLVVPALRPSLDREIRAVNARNAAFTHHNFAENVVVDGNRGAEQLVFAFVGGSKRRWQPDLQRLESDLLLELAECRLVHADSTEIVAEGHIFRIAVLIDLRSLKCIDVERTGLRLHDFARPLVAGRKPVTLVESLGDHDLVLAVHQVKRGRILQCDANAEFEMGHRRALDQFVVAAYDFDDLAG